ncbi:MAG: hypothetical protein IJX91_01965 [Clostridia bacterium]|nr:hypothetical protein [Clostridia bacterium]
MRKITAHEVALSALSCAIATVFLTLGVYSDVFVFTGYMLAGVALMLPLAAHSYRGYALAYAATCLLSLLFGSFRFWDLLPFVAFFGLHPLANELQIKRRFNRWAACALKAAWFDGIMYVTWKFVFAITTEIGFIDTYILPIILVAGTAFFLLYDYVMFRARAMVNMLVKRIGGKK